MRSLEGIWEALFLIGTEDGSGPAWGFSQCFRGAQQTLADFFLLFQAPGQKLEGVGQQEGETTQLCFLPLISEMSADGGGTRAAQDKERAREVWMGHWVKDACLGRTQSRRGFPRQGRIRLAGVQGWWMGVMGGVEGMVVRQGMPSTWESTATKLLRFAWQFQSSVGQRPHEIARRLHGGPPGGVVSEQCPEHAGKPQFILPLPRTPSPLSLGLST